ncbi:MAG: DUF3604 domain-containing protein [Candidatus Helarchaeota archaeon]
MSLNKKSIKKLLKSSIPMVLIICIMFLWVYNPRNINYEVYKNNEFYQFWIKGPSIIQKNEPFILSVQVWDRYERLSVSYSKTVKIIDYIYNYSTKSLNYVSELISSYKFTVSPFIYNILPHNLLNGYDNGMHIFSNLKLSKPGLHYLKVVDENGNWVFSNPIIVTNSTPKYRIYWGDIHGHTAMSDGSGTMEEAYNYARDIARLDFVAITDHDFLLVYRPNVWEYIKSVANKFNSNNFVTILAYEWTSMLPPNTPDSMRERYAERGIRAYGHINVYFKDDTSQFYPVAIYKSPDDLWNALHKWKNNTGGDVITIPHHTATHDQKYDWSYYDSELMPLVEVYSVHGSSECMESEGNPRPIRISLWGEINKHGYYIRDALAMGYRVGFMCSSDTHDGRLGHSLLHTKVKTNSNYPLSLLPMFRISLIQEGSLVAVICKNLTRSSIFYGLKNRSCYGTTHVNRMILNFSINGHPIGYNRSEFEVPDINSVENISFTAISDQFRNFTKIEIFRNNMAFLTINKSGIYNSTSKIGDTILGPVVNYTLTKTHFNFTIAGTEYKYGITKNGKYYISETANKPLESYSESNPPSTNGSDFYYLRVIQEKPGVDDIGWIGPIWITPKS